MSRINDALKRAQAAQRAPMASNATQWQRPAPEQTATRGIGMAVPFVFGLIALLGLFFLWQVHQEHATQTHALPEPKLVAAADAAPARKPQTALRVKTVAASIPKTAVAVPRNAKPIAPAVTGPTPAPQAVSAPVSLVTPAPPALTLQAVLFSGQNSSAMINGQTVTAGDSVGEYRVTAINRRSVTLISASHTNVLTLTAH